MVRDVIVVGGTANGADGQAIPGDIRAYDARTGARAWTFKVIPEQEEFGADTWLQDSYAYSANGGLWGFMSGDDELGYVYLPTTTEVPTFFGPSDSPLFGVLHLPVDKQIRGGVLICGSLGKEGMDSVRLHRLLADRLARSGFGVLSLPGTISSPLACRA